MTIDQVRNYWNNRPCNIRHSSVDIDEDPKMYSLEVTRRKRFVEPHTLWFPEFARWQGKRVLELGCGIGTDAIAFALAGANVVAVDISKESVWIAQKRRDALGLHRKIRFGIANIEESLLHPDIGFNKTFFSYKEAEMFWCDFDLVYSFGVIHHTPHPFMPVLLAYRYLKPGGTFKLMLYNRYSWRVLCILVRNLGKLLQWRSIDKVVALESEAQTGCPITWTFTKKKARDLLESQGFIIQEMAVEHIFPYEVQPYIDARYVKAFPWKFMPRRLFQWLEHKIGWHLCITAIKPEVG